jgi:hypothetical protein
VELVWIITGSGEVPKPYSDADKQQMRARLSEKERKRYAALETRKLAYGRMNYLCLYDDVTIGQTVEVELN